MRERNGGIVEGGLEWQRRMLEGSWTCMGAVSGDVGCRYGKGAQSRGDTASSIRFERHFVAMAMNKAERWSRKGISMDHDVCMTLWCIVRVGSRWRRTERGGGLSCRGHSEQDRVRVLCGLETETHRRRPEAELGVVWSCWGWGGAGMSSSGEELDITPERPDWDGLETSGGGTVTVSVGWCGDPSIFPGRRTKEKINGRGHEVNKKRAGGRGQRWRLEPKVEEECGIIASYASILTANHLLQLPLTHHTTTEHLHKAPAISVVLVTSYYCM